MKKHNLKVAADVSFSTFLFFIFLLFLHITASTAAAQDFSTEKRQSSAPDKQLNEIQSHMVVVDGRSLFRVAGIKAFPAKIRARLIAARIKQLAEDPSFDPATLKVVEDDGVQTIYAGDRAIIHINPADVSMEGDFSAEKYAKTLVREQVIKAIENYRHERSPATLKKNGFKALYRTSGLILFLLLLFWSFKKTDQLLEQRFKKKIEKLESKSKRVLQAQQIWNLTKLVIRISRVTVVLLVIYIFMNFVLGLFPWTRYFALTSLNLVINPLRTLGHAFINYLPSLFFTLFLVF